MSCLRKISAEDRLNAELQAETVVEDIATEKKLHLSGCAVNSGRLKKLEMSNILHQFPHHLQFFT